LTSFKELSKILLKRKPGFGPTAVHVGSVIGKVALGWVFFLAPRLSPAGIPAPVLHKRTNLHGSEVTQTTHAMYV